MITRPSKQIQTSNLPMSPSLRLPLQAQGYSLNFRAVPVLAQLGLGVYYRLGRIEAMPSSPDSCPTLRVSLASSPKFTTLAEEILKAYGQGTPRCARLTFYRMNSKRRNGQAGRLILAQNRIPLYNQMHQRLKHHLIRGCGQGLDFRSWRVSHNCFYAC